jgi:pilus assembly protein Flp/PilA
MMRSVSAFLANDDGATAIEYGLIAAIVGVGIILGLQSVRTELQATLTKVSSSLKTATN